jgi:hypothetical protein
MSTMADTLPGLGLPALLPPGLLPPLPCTRLSSAASSMRRRGVATAASGSTRTRLPAAQHVIERAV